MRYIFLMLSVMFSFPCLAVEETKTVDAPKCTSPSSLCDDDGRVELFTSSTMVFSDLVFTSIDGNIYIVDELRSDPFGMYTTIDSLRLIYTGYHEDDDDDDDDDTEWMTCSDGSKISKRSMSKDPYHGFPREVAHRRDPLRFGNGANGPGEPNGFRQNQQTHRHRYG